MRSFSNLLLIMIMLTLSILSFATQSFAQSSQGGYTIARIEIWSLFYRLMVIAFVVGALVLGVMGYIVWRFRESHPQNRFKFETVDDGGQH